MMRIPCKKIFLTAIITFFLLSVNIVSAASEKKVILAFGDSLTAGYGIPLEKSFPAQLEDKLKEHGYDITVINAGVTGDTTSSGLTRLRWTLEMLEHRPDFIILELGANDMLRGTDPAVTRRNLQRMLEILREKKIPVLLSGMKAMPNLGIPFGKSTQKMYGDLARKYAAVYYPFFMEGVAGRTELLQDDGLHPNVAGVALIVDGILPSVKKLLGKIR